MLIKIISNAFFASLLSTFILFGESAAATDTDQVVHEEIQTKINYAVFKNPRKHRSSSSVYAIRIDGMRVRLGKQLKIEPGVHTMDLIFNGQRAAFEAHMELEFQAGVTYRPKYKRVDVKGLEHIVAQIIEVESKDVVAKSRPYLPRYSRRSVNPRR